MLERGLGDSYTNLDANQYNLKCNNYLFKMAIHGFYSKMYCLHP